MVVSGWVQSLSQKSGYTITGLNIVLGEFHSEKKRKDKRSQENFMYHARVRNRARGSDSEDMLF